MTPPPIEPVALTIAGSDSGGNAGIQADLRAFHIRNVHGCAIPVALTAQNPFTVAGWMPVPPDFVRLQLDTVFDAYAVRAVKTGMLANAGIITAVAGVLASRNVRNLVVDPVMVASCGARLLDADAETALPARLFPLAALITPNLPEAAVLLGRNVETPGETIDAASELHARFGCGVLLKGGHGKLHDGAVDILCENGRCWRLHTPAVADPLSLHGTGCTLSAALAAALARGATLREAAITAKACVYAAIRDACFVGEKATVLGMPRNLPLDAVGIDPVR